MKILLISDTHGYMGTEIIDLLQGVDEVWHAGDIGDLKVIDRLKEFATVRAVWGNIDNRIVRSEFKANLYFKCEDVNVMITHIGGYPRRYDKKILPIIEQEKPDLFICGHSHILKIMYDKKHKLLHMNPGAIGNYGIHKVKTILSFKIEGKDIKDLKVIEFPRTKS